MGFLQQDTNNIILDAVLTTEGRRALAANNGTFRVTHFSLGDDEVDYGIVTKFGRAVGRQKIELNTPVFEALTNENLEALSRLITISDDTQTVLSTMTTSFSSGDTLLFNTVLSNAGNVVVTTVQSAGANAREIPVEIRDQVLQVSVDRRFLTLGNQRPFSTTGNTAHYNVTVTNPQDAQPSFSFTLTPASLGESSFTTFGNTADKTTIMTTVRVQGRQSGLFRDLSSTLNRN